jgi:LuxR family maltose regulon positive regulatory protein
VTRPPEPTPTVRQGRLLLDEHRAIAVASSEWHAWLEDHDTFTMDGAAQTFGARCEVRSGARYWYGYRRRGGRLRKTYLGKSENLTWSTLVDAARRLNEAPQARPPSPESTDDATSVLQTKLSPPPLARHTIERSGLVHRMTDAIATGRHLLVSAPTGFGKTTLLAQCAAHLAQVGQATAWLTLDSDDDDVRHLLRGLLAAVGRVMPEVGAQAGAALRDGRSVTSARGPLTALLNELDGRRLVVVVDDCPSVTAPTAHDALGFLLRHAPTGVSLVVAGRTAPPIPLGLLRARGRLRDIGPDDLRFDADEAEGLLARVTGHDLPARVIDALHDKTQGWAAALQLAALSLEGLEGADEVDAFMAAFSGEHRHVVDYLTEEVLAHLPADVLDFLLRTCVLDRLTAPLCDQLTGRDDSADVLARLERANLFLLPLDGSRRWYRYHPLFADVLRAHHRTGSHDGIATLHLRAADWFAAHGMPAEAIHHALAADDVDRAAGLVERSFLAVGLRGDAGTVLSWLRRLPAGLAQRRVGLCLAYAGAYILDGRYSLADPWLARAEPLVDDACARPCTPS